MAFYDSVAQLSGGSSHVIRESRHRTVKTYVELLDSFRNLLWEHRGPVSQVMFPLERNVIHRVRTLSVRTLEYRIFEFAATDEVLMAQPSFL